jgi:hypothetical protein
MALPKATLSSFSNHNANTLINGHLLFGALIDAPQFRSKDHVTTIQDAKVKVQERKLLENNTKLELLASLLSCDNRRTILQGKETGQWLTVMPLAPSMAPNSWLRSSETSFDPLFEVSRRPSVTL